MTLLHYFQTNSSTTKNTSSFIVIESTCFIRLNTQKTMGDNLLQGRLPCFGGVLNLMQSKGFLFVGDEHIHLEHGFMKISHVLVILWMLLYVDKFNVSNLETDIALYILQGWWCAGVGLKFMTYFVGKCIPIWNFVS